MKIIWDENPLKSKVQVNRSDRERILLYIKNEQYSDILCEANLWIKGQMNSKESPTLEGVGELISRWEEICNMDEDAECVRFYVVALQGTHGGDCTCAPAPCVKCFVEEAVGFSTIPGLSNHAAAKIGALFEKFESIDDVLFELSKGMGPDGWPSSMDYDSHIPRWEAERVHAYEWLSQYKLIRGF